jgi:2-oxoglutarate dehydrogenase E2 component (dihydrolipoamide succinyltransferase)
MAFEVRFPVVGESVQEGQVYKWRKKTGDYVKRDEVLVEIETDKATVEIVSESEGQLSILKKEGETVSIGEVLATLDSSVQQSSSSSQAAASEVPPPPPSTTPPSLKSKESVSSDSRPQSPAVARMVAEGKIDTSDIPGTGRDGRLTKEDLVKHAAKPVAAKDESVKVTAQTAKEPAKSNPPSQSSDRVVRREKMSRIRQRIAERLVEAQHTAAMLTTFNEVDMSGIMEIRKRHKDVFKEKYGVNLGFMSFFVKAAVEALKAYPPINGYVDGHDIVYHDYCDIGVAVSTDRGLMVPVVRNCEGLSFSQVELSIAEYAKKGRDGKISLDDLNGGTFTISNGGVFGSLLSTPILNPPQSAILGMHKIQDRAVVINGEIVIRPMMYLALSYDHRIVDGKEAVGFLVKIKDALEDPSRLLLGV